MILYLHGFRVSPASHKAQRLHARMQEKGPAEHFSCPKLPDELLDYRQALTKYAGARQTVVDGGDHSFTRWSDYLDDIIRYARL